MKTIKFWLLQIFIFRLFFPACSEINMDNITILQDFAKLTYLKGNETYQSDVSTNHSLVRSVICDMNQLEVNDIAGASKDVVSSTDTNTSACKAPNCHALILYRKKPSVQCPNHKDQLQTDSEKWIQQITNRIFDESSVKKSGDVVQYIGWLEVFKGTGLVHKTESEVNGILKYRYPKNMTDFEEKMYTPDSNEMLNTSDWIYRELHTTGDNVQRAGNLVRPKGRVFVCKNKSRVNRTLKQRLQNNMRNFEEKTKKEVYNKTANTSDWIYELQQVTDYIMVNTPIKKTLSVIDEIFWGYIRYCDMPARRLVRKVYSYISKKAPKLSLEKFYLVTNFTSSIASFFGSDQSPVFQRNDGTTEIIFSESIKEYKDEMQYADIFSEHESSKENICKTDKNNQLYKRTYMRKIYSNDSELNCLIDNYGRTTAIIVRPPSWVEEIRRRFRYSFVHIKKMVWKMYRIRPVKKSCLVKKLVL